MPSGVASNSAVLHAWPFSRPTHSIPTPLPSCPELVKALHPVSGAIPSNLLPELTWQSIVHLCKGN